MNIYEFNRKKITQFENYKQFKNFKTSLKNFKQRSYFDFRENKNKTKLRVKRRSGNTLKHMKNSLNKTSPFNNLKDDV